jgi:hypothetical protein
MKTVFVLIAILAALPARIVGGSDEPAADATTNAPAKLTDDELGDLLQQAILLAKFGLYDEAAQRCRQILEQKPDQATVKQLLREIEEMRRRAHGQDPAYDFKRSLESLVLTEVNFRDAEPAAVIDFLRAETKKLTPDKKPINFVWLVPPDAKLGRVTLHLQNIPLLDVVRYTTLAAGLRYRVDPHAIVIYQQAPAPPQPAAPEPNVESR